MKFDLKHLFPLLLAISMIVVGCDKNNPVDKNGYLYNEDMYAATRLSSAENNLPENHYYLSFCNTTGDKGVQILLVGAEGETSLQPGTYTHSGDNLLLEQCAVIAGEEVYMCHKGNGTVVVTVKADEYSFDIELSDSKNRFHFTYTGTVEGMGTTEPVIPDNNVYFTATSLEGMHMASITGNVDSYLLFFSNAGEETQADIIYQVTLSNVLGKVDEDGYVTVPSGTYTLSDSDEEFTIATYSCYATISSDGYESIPYEEATFVATETQSVLTAVIEGVTHVMTYNGPLSMVADLPEPPAYFEATHAYAYYAPDIDGTGTADIFKVYFSDFGLDAEGNEQIGASYYEFDILIDALEPGADIAIPAGTYEISTSEYAPGYVTRGMYYKYEEDSYEIAESEMAWGGHLTINEDGTVEAECKILSGSTHYVTFAGNIEILENLMPTEPPYSTLTGDKVCDFSNHGLIYYDGSEDYDIDLQTWIVSISGDDNTGDCVSFTLLSGAKGESDITGKYTVSDSMGEYTALPGHIQGFTLVDSWYYYREDISSITEYAPVVAGWVEITENADRTITVAFDVYDDLNNNITGSWTSNSTINSKASASKASLSVKPLAL